VHELHRLGGGASKARRTSPKSQEQKKNLFCFFHVSSNRILKATSSGVKFLLVSFQKNRRKNQLESFKAEKDRLKSVKNN
jgi:hypothetical protein